MSLSTPRSTLTDTLFPYTVLFRSLGLSGAVLLLVDLHATGSDELGDLLSKCLPVRGDARIAVDHATIVHRIYASRKRPDFRRFRSDAEPMIFASSQRVIPVLIGAGSSWYATKD